MSRPFRLALVSALFAAFALAQEADPQAPARAAFARIEAAMEALRAAGQDAAKRKEAGAAYQAAQEEFRLAFAKSDWDKWDPAADKNLLLQGLAMNGFKALETGDAQTAVKAFDMIAAKIPDFAGRFAAAHASAYLASGGFEKALAFVQKTANAADEQGKPGALVLLGDYQAAAGDAAAAQKSWEAALAAVPADADQRNRAKSDAEMRLAFVGKDAPEIAASTWIDGETKPLSALKGSVVVVDFWATWCPPCRQVMPSLDAFYKEKKAGGLLVLGVTRFYANGFMPKAGTKDLLRDGDQVAGITQDGFLDHVKQFKTNAGLSYPFAIATEAEFQAYKVQGIPTLVVVGRDGKVAFVKVGGGDETLLKVAVERALGTKS